MRQSSLILVILFVLIILASYLNTGGSIAFHGSDVDDTAIANLTFDFPNYAEIKEISNRTLFAPSRRPLVWDDSFPEDIYRLRGVLLASMKNVAILEKIHDRVSIRVAEGETVGGWEVFRIDSKGLIWRRSSCLHEMVISRAYDDALLPPDYADHERAETEVTYVPTIPSALLPPPPSAPASTTR